MLFQIKELILWPRNRRFGPRRVRFEVGKVTVISGNSRTGKSAVIPIIDYCLASRSCSIPVKTIRDSCEWFGIVVTTDSGDRLLARREPGSQRLTDDMFLLEASNISDIPETITRNTSAGDIRRYLDELAGLSNLDFGADSSQSSFDSRPSFRDLAAFLFQPQNVVANPEVLFFKTDRYEHREKLRKIFPYVLGAVTPALLAKQQELKGLQNDLRRKERELNDAEQVSSEWVAELQAQITEARELGLLNASADAQLTRDDMLELLQGVVEQTDISLAVSSQTISDAVSELNSLDSEESLVSFDLTRLRRRLSEMNRVRDSVSNYHEALRIQQERLQLADWIGRHRSKEASCPICGGSMQTCDRKLDDLIKTLRDLETETGQSFEIPAVFDREILRVQNDLSETTEKLKAIQIRKQALSQRSEEAKAQQYQAKRVERFIGNVENALRLQRKLGQEGGLRDQVANLRNQCLALGEGLRRENIEARKRRALSFVNAGAQRLMPFLDAERPDDPLSLEIDDLTVKVAGANRDDYLSEIGSGSNWLSYHIAVSLALHQFFLSLDHSSVPGFLVLDQPSQVYFPKRLAVRETETPDEPELTRDQDVVAVRKAFALMAQVVGSASGRLQIIVLDHASQSVWGDIPNIVAFEEWRSGETLVPTEWISL